MIFTPGSENPNSQAQQKQDQDKPVTNGNPPKLLEPPKYRLTPKDRMKTPTIFTPASEYTNSS